MGKPKLEYKSSTYEKFRKAWDAAAPQASFDFDLVINDKSGIVMDGLKMQLESIQFPQIGLTVSPDPQMWGFTIPDIVSACTSVNCYFKAPRTGVAVSTNWYNTIVRLFQMQFTEKGTLRLPADNALLSKGEAEIKIGYFKIATFRKLTLSTPMPSQMSYSNLGNPLMFSFNLGYQEYELY